MFEVYDTVTGETVAKARNNIRAIALADEMQETASWIGKNVKLEVRCAE